MIKNGPVGSVRVTKKNQCEKAESVAIEETFDVYKGDFLGPMPNSGEVVEFDAHIRIDKRTGVKKEVRVAFNVLKG
jgi:hypothetical protein